MVDDYLVADGDKGLIRAIDALPSGLEQAKSGLPFVRAGRCVMGRRVFLLTNRTGKMSARPRYSDRNNRTLSAAMEGSFPIGLGICRAARSGAEPARAKFSAKRLDGGPRLCSPLISLP